MKLYRYRSINSKDLSRTFTHYELYFASPTQFNDPFDCNPPFSTTDYNKDDLLCHYRKAYKNFFPELDNSVLETEIKKKVDSVIKNNTLASSIAKPFMETCLEENSKLGVLCFSEDCNNILLWSHYADSHRGLVLEFDKLLIESENAFKYCKDVDYKNNIIKLRDINRASPGELAKMVLLMKSDHWIYEKEWRIIVDPSRADNPGCRIFPYPKEALTGVIFGCEMQQNDKCAVIKWLEEGNHKAQLYDAERDIGDYSLKINPMATSQNP